MKSDERYSIREPKKKKKKKKLIRTNTEKPHPQKQSLEPFCSSFRKQSLPPPISTGLENVDINFSLASWY